MRDRVRVSDSTPIMTPVTTEDTITQLRSVICKTLTALRFDYQKLAVGARAVCHRDDDYLSAGMRWVTGTTAELRKLLVDALLRGAGGAWGA